nr:MAG TPA_asm: hypothetical protein [Caudoviricetes sp.]
MDLSDGTLTVAAMKSIAVNVFIQSPWLWML